MTTPPTASASNTIERPQSDAPVTTEKLQLAKFSGAGACTQLETYIEDTLTQQMRAALEYQRDNPSPYRIGVPGITLAAPVAAPAPAPPSARSDAAPANFSTTNVRTDGVDEPDVMKNDGTRMFVISGQDVVHLQSWPAAQMKELARSSFVGSRPSGLLLLGNRLLVMSTQYAAPIYTSPLATVPALGALPPPCIDCRYPDTGKTIVSVFDISLPSTPVLQRTLDLPGSLIATRLVGQSLRAVVGRSFQYPAGLEWIPPVPSNPNRITPTGAIQAWEPWASTAERTAAFNASIAKNESIIRSATLAQWVPADFPASECGQVFAPNATSAFGWTTLASLDLAQPSAQQAWLRQHALTEPGLVYQGPQNLHLVSRHWYRRTAAAQTDTSYVHRFGFTAGTGFELLASGTFEGGLKDDYSIDEHNNADLRIASQLVKWRDNAGRLERINSTRVVVLRAGSGTAAGKLEQIGQTAELATGETLQSARIMGTRGFVVTFRQVDPLFTLDLSDGRNPRVLGELKVPGFSTYLHPVDDKTILGIGTFLPEPDVNGRIDGSQRRVQMSLFDVSDMRAPKQSANLLLGSVSASSAALYEHKAFTYLAAAKRVALPFFDYGPPVGGPVTIMPMPFGQASSTLKVFDLDPANADAAKRISTRGEISMNDLTRNITSAQSRLIYMPWVQRGVLADDICYAVGEGAVRAANVSDLTRPLATVNLVR